MVVYSKPDDCCRHVMFLSSTLAVGGSERKTVRIANALAERGWKLTIGYLNAPHTLRDEISDDVNVVFLCRRGKFSFGALRRLVAYVSQYKVEMICCINLYPLLYAYLARKISLIPSLRILATINSTEFVGRKDASQMLLYAPILRRIDAMIFGAQYQMNLWVSRYKFKKSECCYIYNGVNTNYFDLQKIDAIAQDIKSDLNIPKTSFIIGSVGRFRKEKQYETVIRACEELRNKRDLDVYCLLVGGGAEEQRLKELVAKLQCEQFVRILDAAGDVRPYLEVMDVFVLSSISETFSNAALEAMSMSLPVVLPRVGGCPEMVRHGETGFIYESGDFFQLVEYLFLLGSEGELRLNMGRAGRQLAIDNFKFESMLESYERMISDSLSKR